MKPFQNAKFTLENQMAMILFTINMKLTKIWQESVFCFFYIVIVLKYYNFIDLPRVKGVSRFHL